MPILKDFRQTKEISLPSFEGSKLVIYESMLVGDLAGLDYKNSDELAMSIETLPKFIKEWNFTNEDGHILPINKENLGFLKMEDVKYLGEQIIEFSSEMKKKVNA